MKQILKNLTLACLLGACHQSELSDVNRYVNLPSETLSESARDTLNETRIPVSQKPGGQIHLRLSAPQAPPPEARDFSTQLLCTVSGDLQSIRIYLIDGSTSFGSGIPLGLLPADITALALPNSATYYPVNTTVLASGQTQAVTLSNVDQGEYYLAVSAHDGPNGTGSNITSLLTGLFSISFINGEPVVVSDGGGNPASPGRVDIGSSASSFPILNGSQATLTVNLKLGLLC